MVLLWVLVPAADWSVFNRLGEGASKEILGIIVSYKVKVKLVVSRGGSVTFTNTPISRIMCSLPSPTKPTLHAAPPSLK